ncbi:unnamed protein product [Prorocentrum cordatum]|uniref:Uncharacterized protein n=1 Tax=Prorocentrum cordatum TaxID=2364126 RepID=A0ABN9VY97_9DINO|nr:unnamed protein product [Polarella glacialis]
MVLKSDRWAALLGQAGGEDEARLVATPGMLEISYSLPASSSPGGAGLRRETKTEMVYQDATQRDEGPRLLVSLASVLKLKGLCEHEHARHDEVLEALKVCRLKYYKEIRWLRDQLQRATGNEGQVFWFDPQEGADLEPEGTEAAMLRELHDANGALREEVAVLSEENARLGEIVQEMASPEVAVRTLLREHGVHEVTVRLRKLLSRGPDGAELAEVIRELAGHDQEIVRLEEELQQLRQKSRDDEERLAELLVQADQLRAEAQSASRRAELEAARVAEAQLRVQQIELRNKALNEEMLAGQASAGPAPPQGVVAAPSEEGAEIAQMRDTISSMRHTMSSSTGQLAVTTRRLAQTFGKLGGHSPRTAPGEGAGDSGTAHDSLEEAIPGNAISGRHLSDRVQDVLRELRDLRSRVGRQDAALFGQLEQQRAELEELRSGCSALAAGQREEVRWRDGPVKKKKKRRKGSVKGKQNSHSHREQRVTMELKECEDSTAKDATVCHRHLFGVAGSAGLVVLSMSQRVMLLTWTPTATPANAAPAFLHKVAVKLYIPKVVFLILALITLLNASASMMAGTFRAQVRVLIVIRGVVEFVGNQCEEAEQLIGLLSAGSISREGARAAEGQGWFGAGFDYHVYWVI